MKKRAQTFTFILFILLCWIASQPAHGQDSDIDSSFVLYHYKGKLLRDSKWGKIVVFQRALSEGLQACGKDGIGTADGVFGNGTQKGLMRLLSCPEFEDLAVVSDHPLHGTVHSVLWKRLLPNTPLPTVHQRAFALSLTHEATDYDRVEWNYGTDDDKSALTWGPYGATVGWGNEVRNILKRIHDDDPELLKDLFGSEFSTAERLMQEDAKKGYKLLKPVHADRQRRQLWKKRLQTLGGTDKGREAYDWFAFGSGKWITPNLRRFYSLIPNAESMATEVDFAFFLDIAMHAGVSKKRIEEARKALDAKQEELAHSLTPSERRRVIGQVWAKMVNPRWRKDRMGRNVVFYVDGIGGDKLSEEEIDAWKKRTGRRASNFGLSDSRKYYPDFLK